MSSALIFSISAAATFPLRCASRPSSSSKVSNIANEEGPSWIAYHEIVPGSAFTKGTADRRKSATSFSLPGLASSGTYSANFVILLSCSDLRNLYSEETLAALTDVKISADEMAPCGRDRWVAAHVMLPGMKQRMEVPRDPLI